MFTKSSDNDCRPGTLIFFRSAHEARERITFVRLRYVCRMGSASAAAVGSSPLLPRSTAPVDDAFCFRVEEGLGASDAHTHRLESLLAATEKRFITFRENG